MKRKHLVIIGISAFLLFYFLVPFVESDVWCYVKDPESNKPKLDEAATGRGVNLSLFGYITILLIGGEHDIDGEICITSIP
jgi:hypothetical protein